MTFPPRLRRNQPEATLFGITRTPDSHADSVAPEPVSDIDQIAKQLTAFASGDVARDLALDLVLNEAVEQARKATGATGAAIALIRGGEMVCRATTGKNAPDLGVRVDMTSGLPAASLLTGRVQQCSDTEEGGLVNAEACRRLGVRSMVIAPLVNGSGAFGILQVFSSEPHVFGEHEIETLDILAKRIVENKASASTNNSAPEPDLPRTESPRTAFTSTLSERLKVLEETEQDPPAEDGWLAGSEHGVNAVLLISVVVTALALGLVIGWRGAVKGTRDRAQNTNAPKIVAQNAAPVRQPISAGASRSAASRPAASAEPPSGGLTVTENGKVIYRADSSRPDPSEAQQTPSQAEPATRWIHRADPEYPEEAKAQRLQGAVVLDVQVLADGTVGNIKVLSGNPLLADAAVKAVKQWQYQPRAAEGGADGSQTQVTVKFSLPAS